MKTAWEALPEEVVASISTMTVQVSQRYAVKDQFFGNFLAYFTTHGEAGDIGNRQTWLHRLPQFAADGSNVALELAVRASASAFSFTRTRHPPLMQDALKLYGRALRQHVHILKTKKKITMHTVSTSVLLSIFEAMNATTASAYRQHISGAAELVKMAGPEECWMGILCQLFFHIRVQMAFVYLTTRQEDKKSLCSEEMLYETLLYYKLPIFQRLISHMTKLTALYLQLEDNDKQRSPNLMDLEEYERIKGGVDALWLEYERSAEDEGQSLFWITPSGAVHYRSAYTSLCVAYFASARALCSILAPRLAATYLDFTDHYQRILDIAVYLGGISIGCAFMRMATPLYLVAMHANSKVQRDFAIAVFEEWKIGGLEGMSALALESIYRRQGLRQGAISIRAQ